ncbi:MAG: T9SS type A sorting domain-containing protein, partial [Bacteroidia bacterium]
NGGSLGSNADWKWYSSSCGGTAVGSGSSISVTPSATTTYFVRAEGTCDTTACTSKSIKVNTLSTAPSSITASTDSVCNGSSVTLSVNGGSLGSNASWKWYSSSCGGTAVGSGSSISVTPSATTTYFVRAEGTCNNTACASKSIQVNTFSTAPTSITASADSVCNGSSVTLSVNGGSLGSNADWKWYSSSCGGTAVGSGSSISVTPSATTTYFVRAEGTCNTSACASKSIQVNTQSTAVSSVIASADSVCPGNSSRLRISGGSLGSNASWKWYTTSCGGTAIGTGDSLLVTPTSTTTYFVRAEGTCNTSSCGSISVRLMRLSSVPSGITASSDSVCRAGSTTLGVTGGTLGSGANWQWYTGSCGGTSAGTGISLSVNPTLNTTYFARAEGICNNTACESKRIIIRDSSIALTGLSATLDTVLPGQTTTLKVVGGQLGNRAVWRWYKGGCGFGTAIGSGDSITVTLSSQTTFYVRAEGLCNNTTCVSRTIFLRDSSRAPTGIIAGLDSICQGTNTTLTPNGGNLGFKASWVWYTGSCGGTQVGTGTVLRVNPSVTTTYWVRAEGPTNTTACASFTLHVRDTSLAVTSIRASLDSVCSGSSSTLRLNGGKLGYRSSWKWYNSSCGGTLAGTGDSLQVSPGSSTTYFVRAEGFCNTTKCESKFIKVNTLSASATSITASTDSVCSGGSSTLRVNGGTLGGNAGWKWYSNSCGGTAIGSGSSIVVNPTTTTTYFVRAEGTCNTTACTSKTIFMQTLSVAPTSVTAALDSLCSGNSVTVRVNGGSLGFAAAWNWFTDSCGGSSIGTGASLTVTPTRSTRYFVRASGACNTTSCESKFIKVNVNSTAPTSITSSVDSLCSGSSVTLSVNGGSLGGNAFWRWYSGSCGGTLVGTGTSISVSPTSNTTYFVRAEGTCNTTSCVSKFIKVNRASTAPTSISASADSVCAGVSVTYTVQGGTLGSNASWRWYSGNCGGTSIGSGTSLTVTPTTSTTYFVRAEGTCNTTACVSKALKLNTFSTAPSGITASADSVCAGTSVTFTASGGSLGSNASWKWYRSSCSGTVISTGNSLTVTPSASETYFVRIEGTCNNTTCIGRPVKINTFSGAPTGITSNADSVCIGSSVTLRLSGGSLGSNASIRWYAGSCGGTPAGSGSSITLTPLSTTTYFARIEGTCNTTICVSKTIKVNSFSVPAVSIISTADSICLGSSVTLRVNGGSLGSNASWRWYENNCGGTSIGSGTSITVSPSATAIYYVRAEGSCNTTVCVGKSIKVNSFSTAPLSISSRDDSICLGTSLSLEVVGGSLGSNASWRWYTGSCGGSSIGSGKTITISPSATTTYFVRAEGTCNSTACSIKSIKVNTFSTAATSILTSADSTCGTTTVTLAVNGGSLGSNASWVWYRGTSRIGTGSSIVVTPVLGNSTYSLRAEGTCNVTGMVSRSIKVNIPSVAATSIISNSDSTCGNSQVTLQITTGTLGSNASWKWYSGSCGGTLVGTGPTLFITPTATTQYFVRAEGTCNTTACVGKTIKVNTPSVAPVSIVSTADSTCGSSFVTLTVNGGSLGSFARWRWYTGNCGSGLIGTGTSITVNPSITTSYFVRAEGLCNATACVSKTIKVNTVSSNPLSIIASHDSICPGGGPVNLSVNGGKLGSNANWIWYANGCGSGTPVGTGNAIAVNPTSTTTYFVQAAGTCNTTPCVSRVLKVQLLSQSATNITASEDSICKGTSVTLRVNGGFAASNARWVWYEGGCGAGRAIGTGTVITVTPAANTSYFVRAESNCNTTLCVSKAIVIRSESTVPVFITSTADTTCGAPITLQVNGGSLGSGGRWAWYTGNCGGTLVGIGNSLTTTPVGPTTYFVRAEGLCNTTQCVRKTIYSATASTAPVAIVASNDTPCLGQQITLTVQGGNLGIGAEWKWYHSSCGGSLIGTGGSLKDIPNGNTTYYVRAEGACNITNCVSRPIRILFPGKPAIGITASADTVLNGANVRLQIIGGSGGSNGRWVWYENGCGNGAPVGFGPTLNVAPGSTTTYYVRQEGTCDSTVCVFKKVSVWGMNVQDQQQLGDLIRLYPNPTKDKLNLMIDVQGNEPTLVKVLDAQGRAIREFSLEAGIRSHVIDVQELSEGQYMLDIRNGRSSAVKRFVKLN